MTREQRREALDVYFARAAGRPGNGLVDYVRRLRDNHRAVIDGKGIYRGCVCGEVLCGKDLLLAWCDELLASYQAKIGEFAAETLRASGLTARAERAEAKARAVEAVCESSLPYLLIDSPSSESNRAVLLYIERVRAALAGH